MANWNQNSIRCQWRSIAKAIALVFWTQCLVAKPAISQEPGSSSTPKFRERTDPNAAKDAVALREQLRYLIDSRGPINPLSDYGLPSRNPQQPQQPKSLDAGKAALKFSSNQDPDAMQAPKLDPESAKRLKASGLTVPSSALGVMALLPPPQLRATNGAQAYNDDGFRPASTLINSPVVTASAIQTAAPYNSDVRIANFYQDDPIANTPPTLTSPPVISGGTLPGGGSLPGSIPTVPQDIPVPYQPYQPSAPVGLPPASTIIPPPTMPSSAVPTTVLPAPPTYYVPAPGYLPAQGLPQGTAAGAMVAQPGVPYAGSPMPTYNRPASFVNSAPFVSPPPAAVDARSMVSPAVWQQSAGQANPSCNPSLASSAAGTGPRPTVPTGMVAPSVPMGINGVTPTQGMVPPTNASPFAYAPPAAMPPQTIYAPANGGYVPLVGFGQGANAQLGRGLYGQPTAYVDGQPVRNFLRYIFP